MFGDFNFSFFFFWFLVIRRYSLHLVSSINSSCQLQVDYEFNTSTETLEIMHGTEHFMSNLSMLLQWSPYSTEADLLKQVIFYNIFFAMY